MPIDSDELRPEDLTDLLKLKIKKQIDDIDNGKGRFRWNSIIVPIIVAGLTIGATYYALNTTGLLDAHEKLMLVEEIKLDNIKHDFIDTVKFIHNEEAKLRNDQIMNQKAFSQQKDSLQKRIIYYSDSLASLALKLKTIQSEYAKYKQDSSSNKNKELAILKAGNIGLNRTINEVTQSLNACTVDKVLLSGQLQNAQSEKKTEMDLKDHYLNLAEREFMQLIKARDSLYRPQKK